MIKELYKNKWVSLMDNDGYVYSHETRCNGDILAVLPYTLDKKTDDFKFLLRHEATPCHQNDELKITSITGGIEHTDFLDSVLMELREEAGVIADKEDITPLGFIYPSKSQDTKVWLYACEVKNPLVKAEGDGSDHESNAYCTWENDTRLIFDSSDSFNIVILSRLMIKEIDGGN